jgi:2-polyprenyl-3-methyl-5-hydroxy-6-metoxy-1,4-benzoquinol methylase
MAMDADTDLSAHFAFGENWASYANLIDEKRIETAVKGLSRLVEDDAIRGRSFLDIGCGSGLHALAAAQLGASRIIAVDIDPHSVETTRRVLAGRVDVPHQVHRISVFELPQLGLGTFDVVYSWGVLHHTGAMHAALVDAAGMVAPGGRLAIALYRKTPLCGAWRIEKRFYAHAPHFAQRIVRGLYVAALAVRYTLTGRSFRRYVSAYQSDRGMDFWHDVHDWLGGYPYESISPNEVDALMQALGLTCVRAHVHPRGYGVFGTGCDEFVYRRESPSRS